MKIRALRDLFMLVSNVPYEGARLELLILKSCDTASRMRYTSTCLGPNS